MVAFFCLFITGLMAVVLAFIATRSSFVPYVVEIDKLGRSYYGGSPSGVINAQPRYVQATLAEWIKETRSVYVDGSAQKEAVENAFSLINQADEAFSFCSEYFKEQSPFKRAENETVTIEVQGTPLPITETAWEIEWIETIRERNGEVKARELWKATVSVYQQAPKGEEAMMRNPLGLFVRSVSWTRERNL